MSVESVYIDSHFFFSFQESIQRYINIYFASTNPSIKKKKEKDNDLLANRGETLRTSINLFPFFFLS